MPLLQFLEDFLSIEKIVGLLPKRFLPNTLYLLKKGTGFDIFCSTSDGVGILSLNSNPDQAVEYGMSVIRMGRFQR